MKFNFTKLWLSTCLITALSSAYAGSDASIHEIYQLSQSGKMAEAQAQMDKVLIDHPESAKAHYVKAELDAKQGLMNEAKAELGKAENLQPGLAFVKPAALESLRQSIAQAHALSEFNHGQTVKHKNLLPWETILLFVIAIALFVFTVRRWLTKPQPVIQANPYPFAGSTINNPVTPSVSYPPTTTAPTSSVGGSILGGLATGAAVGAGMVAGETLMHRILDDHSTTSNDNMLNSANAQEMIVPDHIISNDYSDFGITDDTNWDDDNNINGDDWT